MRPNTLAVALALAVLALPGTALAQDADTTPPPTEEATPAPADADAAAPAAEEEETSWNWNLALTSDYVFRGITQSNYDPALQAGLGYTFGDSGIYVSAWTSNIDFQDSDGPDIEFDSTIGWSKDLTDDWNLDLSAVYYSYFGEQEAYGNIDYVEMIGKVSWKEMLTFTTAYAPDYSNADYSSLYFNLGGSWDLGHDWAINAGIGHSDFSDDNQGYTDWNLGVSKQWGPANFALNYYDTDLDFEDAAEHHHASDQVVLSISFGN